MELENLSIRARVAFGVECLEKLIEKDSTNDFDWDRILLSKLWEYTYSNNLGLWHYTISEYTPFSVLEEIPFEEKECEFIRKSEYKELRMMYQNSNRDLLKCIDLIFEIGTLDLYSSIVDRSQRTLLMLEEIIQILKDNQLMAPDIIRYETLTINNNSGWGVPFYRSDSNFVLRP